MTIRKKATILSNINTDLADNNAGSISAEDVRSNVYDAVESINSIVGSGNHDSSHPFVYNVRASNADGSHGLFIAESGIQFPNQDGGSCTQIMCYPGPNGISHNDLADLATGDTHTQYYPVDGSRTMLGNVPMTDSHWIGSSGVSNVGLKFVYAPRPGGNTYRNDIHVGMSGDFLFQKDQSRLSSAKGIAKAWINFDGSGVGHIPVVRSSHNVVDLKHHSRGKYTLSFASGVFKDNDYVVVATSNSTTASGSMEDFDVNSVGVVMRYGSEEGSEKFRKCTFAVRNDAGEYVDGEINDLVVFGAGSGVADETCNVTQI